MPRFVILHHDCPDGVPHGSHWDLMLEADGVLRTWALAELPAAWAELSGATATQRSRPVIGQQLSDHRLDYLTYEGPVSGGRGTVRQVEAGTYESLAQLADEWLLRLKGTRITGRLRLTRTSGDSEIWHLEHQQPPDRPPISADN